MWSVEIQKDLRSVSIIARACLQAVTGSGGALVTRSYLTFVTPWTVAHQASLSMGFSRQEYWSGLPFPSPPLAFRARCLGACLLVVNLKSWGTRYAV